MDCNQIIHDELKVMNIIYLLLEHVDDYFVNHFHIVDESFMIKLTSPQACS